MDVIKTELLEVKKEFGDDRRTEICESAHDLTLEDLITEEDRVVTISNGGSAKLNHWMIIRLKEEVEWVNRQQL